MQRSLSKGWWLWLLLSCLAPSIALAEGHCLAAAARVQIGVTVGYDPAYVRLGYPGGDVPERSGVCTDVLVRAYRLLGIDLQKQVHEDMRRAWSAYPQLWGLRGPDRNIDHRRVPNLVRFFDRHGQRLGVDEPYLAGDIVSWRLANGAVHIGLVSDRRAASGDPLIIHNIGAGTREEDVLRSYVITDHQRYHPAAIGDCGQAAPTGLD